MQSGLEKEIYILSEGGSEIKVKILDDELVLIEDEKNWKVDSRYYATIESAITKKDSEGKKLENDGYARMLNELIDNESAVYFKSGKSAYLKIERVIALPEEIVDNNGVLSYRGNLLRE